MNIQSIQPGSKVLFDYLGDNERRKVLEVAEVSGKATIRVQGRKNWVLRKVVGGDIEVRSEGGRFLGYIKVIF